MKYKYGKQMVVKRNSNNSMRNLPAVRVIVSTVGVLCGISGIEHGFFETLQGDVAPQGLLISAIGPANRFWPGGEETALTVIPNFLITGILAIAVSLIVIVWSAAFIQKRSGAAVFLILSIAQFLVGGGFAQIFLVLITAAAATQINHPWKGWRILLPNFLRRFLGKLWLYLLILFAVCLLNAIFAAIFGFLPLFGGWRNPGGSEFSIVLYQLGYVILGLLPLTILAGLAHEIEKQASVQGTAYISRG